MRMPTRSKKQIEANQLDLQIFRAVRSLDEFSNEFGDDAVHQMAGIIDAMRHRVRRHMHKEDRESTGA